MFKENPRDLEDKDVESQHITLPPDHLVSTKTPSEHISILVDYSTSEGSPDCRPETELTVIKTPTSPEDTWDEAASQDNIVVSTTNDNDHGVGDLHLQFMNISKIIKDKDAATLCEFGGGQGFAVALGTDLEMGIPEDDQYCCCRQIASKTSHSEAPSKRCIFLHLLRSSNNYIIILLLVSALLSIGFGIKEEGIRTGWCEGVIILFAVVILVFPSIQDLLNDLLKLPQKNKLMEEKVIEVDVVRGGVEKKIFISDILLGDVVCLKRGYQIPADGLFITGNFLDLDDGSKAVVNGANPFLFYGAEVINGEGRMLVTSVGENTLWAEKMSSVCHLKRTPFEAQLDTINTWKQIVGLIISIVITVVLFLRFELVKSAIPEMKGKPIKVNEFKDVVKRIVTKPYGKSLTTSLTMLLVGVVEGLPFFISLATAYWRRTGKTFAQELSACVAMGSVTAICTDKTGGLTLEPLEVDKFLIGEEEITEESVIASHVVEAIRDGISTTLLLPQALRSATDEPLLSWAMLRFRIKLEALRRSCPTILQVNELIDEERRGLVMRKNDRDRDTVFLHCTGPATKILPKCSSYVNNEGMQHNIDEQKKMVFQQIVEEITSMNLKVIAFAYKPNVVPNIDVIDEADLILLGLVSLKISIRADIKESIEACRRAGVRIILISRDDVEILVAIAQQFGILQENQTGHEVITGQDFRNLTEKERMEMASEISVMGNSLPSDKCLLVNVLKKNGDSVAVIGIGTSDVPVLKAADVGLAMGSWSANVTRANADIILWDTNISILLPVLRYGRCIYNNIQKYIQLELTMLVSGLLIASITTACTGNMPITNIQSSWVNIVVPILGGLALLTEPPSKKLMELPSEPNKAVITKAMWKNIISQAIYQVTILLTFQFKGQAILGITHKVNKTMIFNSFVLCQLFNQFDVRKMVLKNKFRAMFWLALGVLVILQEIFIEIAHLINGGNSRLNWPQWGICFLIGMAPKAIDSAEKFILGIVKA